MIYFIDEDEIQLRPFLLEMALRNFETHHILTADDAIQSLDNITANDFLFIDVMLAANSDETKSVFKRDQTEDYKTTGLALAQMILTLRKDIVPGHIVLMSQAASQKMKSTIKAFAKKYCLKYIAKSLYDDPMSFGDEVERILRGS